MNKVTQEHDLDCLCTAACDCCDGLEPSHVEATAAGLKAVDTALRDPTADDIPRDKRGSFVQRLGVVRGMILEQRDLMRRNEIFGSAETLDMIAGKVGGIVIDLAEAKGESDDNGPIETQ